MKPAGRLPTGRGCRNRTKDGTKEVTVSSLVQIVGALLILAGFSLAQARVLAPQARSYLVLNIVGASVLAVDAYFEKQWGFLLLEGAWAMIAAYGLLRRPATDAVDA